MREKRLLKALDRESLLLTSSVQMGHRVLGTGERFTQISGLELALLARPDLDSAGRVLSDRLVEMCSKRAQALLSAAR